MAKLGNMIETRQNGLHLWKHLPQHMKASFGNAANQLYVKYYKLASSVILTYEMLTVDDNILFDFRYATIYMISAGSCRQSSSWATQRATHSFDYV